MKKTIFKWLFSLSLGFLIAAILTAIIAQLMPTPKQVKSAIYYLMK